MWLSTQRVCEVVELEFSFGSLVCETKMWSCCLWVVRLPLLEKHAMSNAGSDEILWWCWSYWKRTADVRRTSLVKRDCSSDTYVLTFRNYFPLTYQTGTMRIARMCASDLWRWRVVSSWGVDDTVRGIVRKKSNSMRRLRRRLIENIVEGEECTPLCDQKWAYANRQTEMWRMDTMMLCPTRNEQIAVCIDIAFTGGASL